METYTLKVVQTEEGMFIDEDGNMSEFALIGLFTYLQEKHSKNISKNLEEYEQQRTNG